MPTISPDPAATVKKVVFEVASSLSLTASLGITNLPLTVTGKPLWASSQKFRGRFQEASTKSWPGRCYPFMGNLGSMVPGR